MKRFSFLICLALTPHLHAQEFALVAVLTDAKALAGLHDVELDGKYAYVAGKGGTVAVIDVADPTKPRIVWSKQDKFFEDAETVLPVGKHLFVGTRDFHSLDISDPTNPKLLHTIADRPKIDRINGMVKLSNVIFAANKNGYIDAFDITNPAKPTLFGALDVKTRDGMLSPHDIDRLGENHIIMTDPSGFGRRSEPGRAAVYRVGEGSKLSLVGKVESQSLAGGNRIRASHSNTAVVTASLSPKAEKADRKPGVVLVDFTDMVHPLVVTSVPFPDVRGPNGLCVAGGVAVAAGGQTILAVDVRDPKNPRVLGTFKDTKLFAAGEDDGHDLVYRDGYLYVTAQNSHSFGVVKVLSPRINELAKQ